MATSALIVDLDGTLWDSVDFYAQLLGSAERANLEEARVAVSDGGNIVGALRRSGVAPDRFAAIATNHAGALRLYPGVATVLQTISSLGIPTGVVTNLPAWLSGPMLRLTELADLFEVRIYKAGKPRPGGILRALARLGVEPSGHARALYLGDRRSDQLAAEAAGVRFAWASYGYAEAPLAAEFQIPTIESLLELV